MTTSSKDWNPDATKAIRVCTAWAQRAAQQLCTKFPGLPRPEIYLFGSTIYENGDQFDPLSSDIDLVVLFQGELDTVARVTRLDLLRSLKRRLELRLLTVLHRTNCEDPAVSIVPISRLELIANVHKSGARSFFNKNIFLDLSTGLQSIGLRDAGEWTVSEQSRQALEVAQGIRNRFLSISANNTGGLVSFDGSDPLPKAMCRSAAQLDPSAGDGQWYDTRLGLELLFSELTRRRTENDQLAALHRRVSIRRGGRGRRVALDDRDQLLLAELLHELAAARPIERTIPWEIRLVGATKDDHERILASLRALAPDAQIRDIRFGSITLLVTTSERSYRTFELLGRLGVLARFFEVESVELYRSQVGDHDAARRAEDPVDRLAASISRDWRKLSERAERRISDWVEAWLMYLAEDDDGFEYVRQPRTVDLLHSNYRPDIVVRLGRGRENAPYVVIDLARLRSRSAFFSRLEQLLRITIPVILVLQAPEELLVSLADDIGRLRLIRPSIRVVPIPQ